MNLFRTSFIRPVHISYFCIENILRLSSLVGFETIYSESGGQIHCILKHGKIKNIASNFYVRQKNLYLRKSRELLLNDMFKIIKDLIVFPFKKILSTSK